jgi:transposase
VSLHPQSDFAIPEETRRVAHAAFPKGSLCLRIADELGPLYCDDQFADLFPTRGQPAASPARLAMTSVLQDIEGFSDRQAAEAVRARIDWKYALGLELTDPGFDHTVLSEFRCRLVQGQAELGVPIANGQRTTISDKIPAFSAVELLKTHRNRLFLRNRKSF